MRREWMQAAIWMARSVGVLAVLAWGWYIVANFRTQQFGFSGTLFTVAAIFVLPIAIVPFLGLRWHKVVLGVFACAFLVIGGAEITAALEEHRFLSKHIEAPAAAPVVLQGRDWPFTHHHLFFDPKTRRWGAGD